VSRDYRAIASVHVVLICKTYQYKEVVEEVVVEVVVVVVVVVIIDMRSGDAKS
jgi:hypothetical protein